MAMTHTKQTARMSLPYVASLLLLSLLLMLNAARSQDLVEPTIHWAYASYFGTGWYKINDQRSAFILQTAPRWNYSEAGFDEDGNREIGYTFRVPVTIGLSNLDFEDIPGIVDPGNVVSLSVKFGVDADIPVTDRFSIRPNADFGYGAILDESIYAWTYRAEIRSKYSFEFGKLDWALLGALGYVGYTPNEGSSDDFNYVTIAAEFGYPINWPQIENDQTMLYWHAGYTDFIDVAKFKTGVDERDSVDSIWQIGVAMGRRREPVRIWFLKFDRLGLGYKYSDSSEHRGISIIFRSLYDL
jgi:hypothetical protein